jgi:lipopolysaccharide export system ATP-binding protein
LSELIRIEAKDLIKRYRRRAVVDGVAFHLGQGEVVGLLGPNGAGKTTSFYMVVGLVRPNSGSITYGGRPITRMAMYRRARLGIGYLPQESSVFRRLTVRQNLKLVLQQAHIPRKEAKRRIDHLVEELHLDAFLDREGAVLSGGERRRAEIARALATEPKFILLDEPFTGIDPVTIEELQGIIRRLRRRGIGILITDHNVDATLTITDRNYIMVGGRIIAQGDEAAIRDDEMVKKFYLGQGYREIRQREAEGELPDA